MKNEEQFEKNLDMFRRAVARLSEAVDEYKQNSNDVIRDGMLQRFEFTTDLAWRATKACFVLQGHEVGDHPKTIMRAAYLGGIVDDSNGWGKLLSDRKATAYAFDDMAAIIAERVKDFYILLLKCLLERLEAYSFN